MYPIFDFIHVFLHSSEIDPEGKSTLDHPDNKKYKPESLKPAPNPDKGGSDDHSIIDFEGDTYVGDFPAGFGEENKHTA